MAKIAINGLGRIGRAAFKILHDLDGVEVAAVNDMVPAENLAYLLTHDTVYGGYEKPVTAASDALVVDGHTVPLYSRRDPAELPWRELGIGLVLECTGAVRREEELARHLAAGARFVIVSAPARTETTATVVYGVNVAPAGHQVISCASCTTNCITPVMEVLDRRIGVERAVMTTIHAYTSTQQLIDVPSKDFRRGRAGATNMLPASTGAARTTTKALPGLAGRFDGVAVRIPIPVGSIADIVLVTARPTSPDEVNDLFRAEATTDRYRGILGVSDEPIVSSDIIGDSRAAIVDAAMTRVVDGTLVKIMSWYDNEWGFTHQMIRQALSMLGIPQPR
ncbi:MULTISPECIES: type I glyceraldehyde-3-phosphate dehydrogenase [unclassified Streptomyces]|uniref:type I glyceraldehyde-3-phosphate dehydrogenase n=1 Tax=unclassified Streptomyces TaxID=2593676 RepID=UPI0029BBE5D5|nr:MULTISPECIES: type I glyceraldehyde-3-phosphate dehydrogenase [unclassified Streptomyces]MDX3771905.1 type I glyceraldehyde-3-phosphate dehydrogenase [Streptomyces sp. AK08-01B]MDX3821415.1 type I glyceraldehyde-3-phosphate dehydrogenase [Streptomyces sp. AK08-01A]